MHGFSYTNSGDMSYETLAKKACGLLKLCSLYNQAEMSHFLQRKKLPK